MRKLLIVIAVGFGGLAVIGSLVGEETPGDRIRANWDGSPVPDVYKNSLQVETVKACAEAASAEYPQLALHTWRNPVWHSYLHETDGSDTDAWYPYKDWRTFEVTVFGDLAKRVFTCQVAPDGAVHLF